MRKKCFSAVIAVILYGVFGSLNSLAAQKTKEQVLQDKISALKVRYRALQEKLENFDGRFLDIAHVAEGRLTTESGVAVSTSDRSNQTTIYYTPYKGNRVALYNGTTWILYAFTQRSLALSGLTGNTNYDVFLYNNSGTLTLELTAWSSDTARATALTTQNGVYVRNGATTRRYLGTIRATSATQTQDTRSQRFVWNYQNQVQRNLYISDATNSWTYATNSWRSANNSTANRVQYVSGLSETLVEARALAIITNGTGTLNYYASGIGVDSTTTNSATIRGSGSDNNMINQCWSEYMGYPGIGFHFLQWLERGHTSTITVYGDNGDSDSYQSGLMGEIDG